MRHTTARIARRVLAIAITAGTLIGPAAATATAPPASAGTPQLEITGRGWGHGRGLSQYGAQGYASRYGWSSAKILDHYYGGTRAGTASSASYRSVDHHNIRVRLMAFDNAATVVGIDSGSLHLLGSTVGVPAGTRAVRLSPSGSGYTVHTGSGCGGPWTHRGTTSSTKVTVQRASGSDLLYACEPNGSRVWYPGTLVAQRTSVGARTMNVTSIEEQIRGVVPRESPASWHSAALESQAVAARSYSLSGDTRHRTNTNGTYADTCDTTLCQVYAGHFEQWPGKAKVAMTDPRTDRAIAATRDLVRLTSSNRIARTEFSSTSGGWTAGGTFPAVQDLGDAVSPLHTWKVIVDPAPLAARWAPGTNFISMQVVERNGLGADGGRARTVRLTFTGGRSVTVTGDQVRSTLGLRSDWFTPVQAAGTPQAAYIAHSYRTFLGRDATTNEIEAWYPHIKGGDLGGFTRALSTSNEWAGTQIDDLYRTVLGRGADTQGRAAWVNQVAAGRRIEAIAADFYGSPEYYSRNGSSDTRFVDSLYENILGRGADPSGAAYWVGTLNRGATRSQVAAGFYGSIESRQGRVHGLYQAILGRRADPAGLASWSEYLIRYGDINLAASLATSAEYWTRAQRSA